MKRCPKCGKSYPDEANFCPVDAGRLVTVATDAIAAQSPGGDGVVGGRFQLGPVIGGSVTGEVHRATDTQGNAAVAVKMVSPSVLAIPQVAQRIERELKQLERVQHRGVAHVIASGKHGDRMFVAQELIEGARPLGELIAASGPIDPQRASEIVLAIGESLIEAAKVGVVHRDLAPKNILVTPDSLRLINFAVPTPADISRPAEASRNIAGVPEFVAPEVAEGKPVDQRSNIYSLGAIYAFLLTGRVFPGEAPSAHAQVPADVDALVVKALEKNPAKRYLTLRQFLDEVERVAHGPEGGVGSTAPFGRAGAGKKELSATLMGFGFDSAALSAKTRQIDVQVPPEAVGQPAQPAAAPVAQAAPVAPQAAAAGPSPETPWSRPPGAEPYSPAQSAMHQAAPHVGAAAVAASAPASPQVAAPRVTGGAAGKKKAEQPSSSSSSKGKFRETMWFKKGELDAAAAEEAAATGDAAAVGKADLLPIDERYTDDGSITRSDAERYSLKTGATSMMQAMREDQASASASVSERELVGEMKGGRNKIIAIIVVAIILAVGIIAAFVV